MLDPKLLRNNIGEVAQKLKVRNFDVPVQKFVEFETARKNLQTEVQNLQNERNQRSKAIGMAKAKGQNTDSLMQEVENFSQLLKEKEDALAILLEQLKDLQLNIPNIPHASVPVGVGEEQNQEIRRSGVPRKFSFTPADHVTLGERLGEMNFSDGAKIAGARFVVLYGPLARLQRALTDFMLDIHTRVHGYQEVYVPYLVNKESMYGTGQLPKFYDDHFHVAGAMPLSLIPTAEVPVTNLARDKIFNAEDLPKKYVAHTPCFRSEAGSYGKDTRGMIRNHQFEKVELVRLEKPENSYVALEELTRHAEVILQRLELPYRVVALSTGDLGFSSAKTYDLEVWLPSQNKYREISSCSNFEDFQARRLEARWKNPVSGKNELVHTLNGSGLAVGRTLVAVLENFQNEDGSISIPEALRSYLNGEKEIRAKD